MRVKSLFLLTSRMTERSPWASLSCSCFTHVPGANLPGVMLVNVGAMFLESYHEKNEAIGFVGGDVPLFCCLLEKVKKNRGCGEYSQNSRRAKNRRFSPVL